MLTSLRFSRWEAGILAIATELISIRHGAKPLARLPSRSGRDEVGRRQATFCSRNWSVCLVCLSHRDPLGRNVGNQELLL